MKVVTVVGARPQFIKSATVSKELRKNHTEIIIHTGQHFDYNMSGLFFDELDIPYPDYNLGISGGTHANMTGRMMMAIEDVLFQEKPDWLLLYGDTNSTLAAALVGAKLHIPICHVEAGQRANSIKNPEEINRICTDHVSSLLLASAESGMIELKREGLISRATMVGDVMYDSFIKYSNKLGINEIMLQSINGNKIKVPQNYYYLTCHREENTSNDHNLNEILNAMENLQYPVIYPVHPRNKNIVRNILNKVELQNTIFVEPVGYLESICLVNNSTKIITDSGGVQREAFFAKKQCVTVLDFISWPETMVGNRNQIVEPNADKILEKLSIEQSVNDKYEPFGDGKASKKIVVELEKNSI